MNGVRVAKKKKKGNNRGGGAGLNNNANRQNEGDIIERFIEDLIMKDELII
jgi:hypothetical protein